MASSKNLEPEPVQEQECKSPLKVYIFGLSCMQVAFQFSLCLSQLNNFFEYLMRGKFGDSVLPEKYNSIQSNLNALFLAGGFTCSVTSGPILKRCSPRFLFVLSMVLIMALNVVQTVSPLPGMYVSRFCIGYLIIFNLFLGPLMVSHCCPSTFVGFLGSFFGFFNAFGMFSATLIKSEVSRKYWFVFFNFPTLFELVRLVIFFVFFNYESPYHIFSKLVAEQTKKKSPKEAPTDQSTEEYDRNQLRKAFNKNKEIRKLVLDLYHKEDVSKQKQYLFTIIEKYYQDRRKLQGVFKTAFSREYRKQFFLGFVLNFARQMTGISVIVLYTKKLYQLLDFRNPELLVTIGGSFYEASCTWWAACCRCSWSNGWAGNCFFRSESCFSP